MIRTILAYKKPLPQGYIPIPEDAPAQKNKPQAVTAAHATLNDLHQAAQVGQWDSRDPNQFTQYETAPPGTVHLGYADPARFDTHPRYGQQQHVREQYMQPPHNAGGYNVEQH